MYACVCVCVCVSADRDTKVTSSDAKKNGSSKPAKPKGGAYESDNAVIAAWGILAQPSSASAKPATASASAADGPGILALNKRPLPPDPPILSPEAAAAGGGAAGAASRDEDVNPSWYTFEDMVSSATTPPRSYRLPEARRKKRKPPPPIPVPDLSAGLGPISSLWNKLSQPSPLTGQYDSEYTPGDVWGSLSFPAMNAPELRKGPRRSPSSEREDSPGGSYGGAAAAAAAAPGGNSAGAAASSGGDDSPGRQGKAVPSAAGVTATGPFQRLFTPWPARMSPSSRDDMSAPSSRAVSKDKSMTPVDGAGARRGTGTGSPKAARDSATSADTRSGVASKGGNSSGLWGWNPWDAEDPDRVPDRSGSGGGGSSPPRSKSPAETLRDVQSPGKKESSPARAAELAARARELLNDGRGAAGGGDAGDAFDDVSPGATADQGDAAVGAEEDADKDIRSLDTPWYLPETWLRGRTPRGGRDGTTPKPVRAASPTLADAPSAYAAAERERERERAAREAEDERRRLAERAAAQAAEIAELEEQRRLELEALQRLQEQEELAEQRLRETRMSEQQRQLESQRQQLQEQKQRLEEIERKQREEASQIAELAAKQKREAEEQRAAWAAQEQAQAKQQKQSAKQDTSSSSDGAVAKDKDSTRSPSPQPAGMDSEDMKARTKAVLGKWKSLSPQPARGDDDAAPAAGAPAKPKERSPAPTTAARQPSPSAKSAAAKDAAVPARMGSVRAMTPGRSIMDFDLSVSAE